MKLNSPKVLALLFSILIFSLPSSSQQVVGGITGTVTDPTGAAVPDAIVKAINPATNLTITAKTGATGTYVDHDLPAGIYKVTFTKDGFKTETHPKFWSPRTVRRRWIRAWWWARSAPRRSDRDAPDEPGGHHQRLRS